MYRKTVSLNFCDILILTFVYGTSTTKTIFFGQNLFFQKQQTYLAKIRKGVKDLHKICKIYKYPFLQRQKVCNFFSKNLRQKFIFRKKILCLKKAFSFFRKF